MIVKQLLLEISIYGVKIQRQPVLEINFFVNLLLFWGKWIYTQQVFFINLTSFGVLERQVSFCILNPRFGRKERAGGEAGAAQGGALGGFSCQGGGSHSACQGENHKVPELNT